MTIQPPSELVIPEQQETSAILRDVDPERLSVWLEELKQSETTPNSRIEQLQAYLATLNASAMPPALRMQAMELLRTQSLSLIASREKKLITASFPLTEGDFNGLKALRDLLSELVIGYKAVEKDVASSQPPLDASPHLVSHRIAELLAHLLFQASILYAPYPKGIWLEMHRLYQQITDNKLNYAPGTVSDIYRQAILFSMCAPQRLRQDEMVRLYDSLPNWIQYIDIGPIDAGKQPNNQAMFIDLNEDAPPSHSLPESNDQTPTRLRIETTPLLQKLRQNFNQNTIPAESNLMTITTPLLRRVIQAIGTAKQREFLRVQGNLSLEASFGLEVANQLFGNQADSPTAQTIHRTFSLPVLNESATGYCVAFNPTEKTPIEIGELVGLRHSSTQASIAVIRWIQNIKLNDSRIGLEILAHNASAVFIQDTEGDNFSRQPALLLPAVRATGQSQSLVIATSPTQVGDVLTLMGLGPITLTRNLETTSSFEQFQFTPPIVV